MNKTTNICMIEDHKLMREGIKLIFSDIDTIKITAEFESIESFKASPPSKNTDVFLLDLSLPDASGISAIGPIKENYPDTPILILTMHDESEFGIRAMQGGAHGYITKDNASGELLTAIETVAKGKKYISRDFSNLIAMNTFGESNLPLHHQLSKREFEVFIKLGEGLTPTEISQQLNISIKTVSTYRNRIMTKLSIENNADITKYCLQNKLIT